jgi:hypothetical protein
LKSLKEFVRTDQHKIAMVIGHPTHELRVFHWLTLAKPTVCFLTRVDSCDRTRPRHISTLNTFENHSIKLGPIQGALEEKDFFSALLNQDSIYFINIANLLYEWFLEENFDSVVADAYEGYNTIHDVCRLIPNFVVSKMKLEKLVIDNYEILLIGNPKKYENTEDLLSMRLTDSELENKKTQVAGYFGLQDELNDVLPAKGFQNCQYEYLRKINGEYVYPDFDRTKPFYEQHGEMRKQQRVYEEVITYAKHIKPVKQALEAWVCE